LRSRKKSTFFTSTRTAGEKEGGDIHDGFDYENLKTRGKNKLAGGLRKRTMDQVKGHLSKPSFVKAAEGGRRRALAEEERRIVFRKE